MNFFIRRYHGACLNVIYRNFKTNCVQQIPRGALGFERKRIKQISGEHQFEDSLEIESETHKSIHGDPRSVIQNFSEVERQSQKKTIHRDSRSIDSIDPVILKYVTLLNDIGRTQHQEKVYSTNFGTIRFDSDNVPQDPEQFDIENIDAKSNTDHVLHLKPLMNETSDQETTKTKTAFSNLGQDFKDESERAFEELFFNDDKGLNMNIDNDNCDRSLKIHKELDVSIPNKVGLIKEDNVLGESNFIDEQFFGKSIDHNTDKNPIINKDSNEDKLPKLNLTNNKAINFMDEQYFGGLSYSGNVEFKNSNDKFNAVDGIVPEIDSMHDLNYIDQTFFKPSLELLKENRKSSPDFSEIKGEIENAVDNLSGQNSHSILSSEKEKSKTPTPEKNIPSNFNDKEKYTSNIALNYLGADSVADLQKISSNKSNQEVKKEENSNSNAAPPKTAYDYVLKKRKEEHKTQFGLDDKNSPGNRSHNKVLSLLSNNETRTKYEMLTNLKKSILYNKYDIVGLYKPYGLVMHEGAEGNNHTLTEFLPDLARFLKVDELFPIHRLDATTSGVLLLATTPTMADTLKLMLKKHLIKKTYWAITKSVPNPLQGLINIPVAEGTIDGKHRMVLRPDLKGMRGLPDKSHLAITEYRVLSVRNSAALVELKPKSGVKHQLRVHMGFGLSCPILGDHKYSHLKKLAPQRLPADILNRLKLKQSKARNLPVYLHSRNVIIPEIKEGQNIFIRAKLPAFFNKTLSILKLNGHKSQVKYDGDKCIVYENT